MLFCKHDWEVIHLEITKSKFQVAVELGDKYCTGIANIPWRMCDTTEKHIQIVTCKKCGKIKKFVEEN